jgi:hypothetical protein
MKVKCIVKDELCLDYGKIYDVIGEEHGLYGVVDESGEAYLYSPECFETVYDDKVR